MKNYIVIPHRASWLSEYFDRKNIDEIVEKISNYVVDSWDIYRIFHKEYSDNTSLKQKFKVYIKFPTSTIHIPLDVPLQHGDIVIIFMNRNIPEDFMKSISYNVGGIYTSIKRNKNETDY